ncbi:hypothetical protein QR680_006927 [Steinernema hermaphroditum]|uniref:Nose resistant-to-fluoxetine protein N-terminal domain-containing protein n=1 Tax=Steinernema hermaphroditum TaxID=289476 RepID=A0AA39HYK3_9BILA|nr:hypothetical protein QR680_006927 [Steinernema hermaphroditum]
MRVLFAVLLLVVGGAAQNGIGFNQMVGRLRELEWQQQNLPYLQISQAPTLEHLLRAAPNLTLSADCLADIDLLLDGLESAISNGFKNMTSEEMLIVKMLDATGKIPPGLLHGHHNFMGMYEECIEINFKVPKTARHLVGSYNRYVIGVNGSCSDHYTVRIGWDFCAPKSCSSDDDLREMSTFLVQEVDAYLGLNFTNNVCSVMSMEDQKKAQAKSPGTWIVTGVMGTIGIVGIAAAIYDYFILPHHKELPYFKSFAMKLFLSFSFYTNIVEIFNTESANKPGQIGPIHCMRFFSMSWVILGHTLGVFLAYSNNPVDVLEEVKYVSTQIIINAYYAVDTFLFISGLLVAFIWFKSFKKNRRQTMSLPAWILYYVHRLLRLSPPYYIAILFYTFVFRTFLYNMPVYMTEVLADPCPKNWWINLIYLNNFINYQEQCYLVSWYLSTDLQIYIFAPLILIPMAIRPLFGFLAAGALFAASTAANLATVYTLRYPPSDYPYGAMDPNMTKSDYNMYTMLIYDAPWIRCQPYIIGMMTGYLLMMKPKMRINRILNLVLWVVTFGLMATCCLTLYDWSNGTDISLTARAMYSALSKPAWGLALSWIIISCFYGYGGPINSFMSWEIWVPLGRLSYCAYLIHVCVVVYVTGLTEGDLIWSNFSQSAVSFIIPVIGLTYFFSIFWSSAFEISLGKVEGLLIGNLRAPRPPRIAPVAPPEAKEDNVDCTMETTVCCPEGIRIENTLGIEEDGLKMNDKLLLDVCRSRITERF